MSKVFIPLMFFLAALVIGACKSDSSSAASDAVIPEEEPVEEVVEKTVIGDVEQLTTWNVAPNPESVTIDGAQVYVTQFGPKLEPMAKDGDGYVAIYDADGTLVDTLVAGLNAPKGSLVRGKTYFVADVDHLLGFNTSTGEKTVDVSFEGKSQFLNGLTGGPGNTLFISGTDVGKVWQVTVSSGKIEEVATIPGANGLAYSNKDQLLYVVGYLGDNPKGGRVHEINLKTKASRVLGSYAGMLDGLGFGAELLFFTDWNPSGGGRIVAMDKKNGIHSVVIESESLSGPADFDIMSDGVALIPMLTGSKVVAVRLY